MTTIVPAVSANFLYVNGGQVSYTSNTTLTIAAVQCRDTTNVFDISIGGLFSGTPTTTVLNFAINGLNGLDTGAIAASTMYYIYAIASQAGLLASGFIASLSNSVPSLPFGYGVYRMIGVWNTDGSSHLIKAYETGSGSSRVHVYDADIAVLTSGASQTLATIGSLAAIVPAFDNIYVRLDAKFIPNTAGDKTSFANGTSAATVLASLYGSVASQPNSGQFEVLSKLVTGAPTVLYINSAATGATSVWLNSFSYSL